MFCMSNLRGRKAKAQQTNQLHRGPLFSQGKKMSCPRWDSNDTVGSRRALYQQSYQGNSAGRGSNLQHNTQRQQCYGTVYSH